MNKKVERYISSMIKLISSSFKIKKKLISKAHNDMCLYDVYVHLYIGGKCNYIEKLEKILDEIARENLEKLDNVKIGFILFG